MIDLNKYIVNNDPGKPFHSSGYAEAANAGHVGAVGGDSYSDRKNTEHSRQVVGSYNRSIIGQNYGAMRAKSVAPGDVSRTSMRVRSDSSLGPALPGTAAGSPPVFNEPTNRPYNPYA